jgi:mannose-1-phosphate guanylyltransferase
MILAAGRGTRLGGFTVERPKPMLELGGRPLLEYNVRLLAAAGVEHAAINLHHRPDVIRDYFGDGVAFGLSLTYSEEPDLLGTAGGVKKLQWFFGNEPFWILYGDNLTSCSFARLAEMHQDRGGVGTIALFRKDDVSPHSAVELEPDGRITRFVEKPRPGQTDSHWISAGLAIMEPGVFDFIPGDRPSDFGFDVFPAMLAAGRRLYGYQMSAREGLWWIDTPGDYARMQTLWKNGLPVSPD